MRVLVTGGAGFIGSHLCERLLRDGHHLAVIDDLNDFYDPALKLDNLKQVRAAGKISFFQQNICDAETISATVRDFGPDAIVHLAARAGVRPSLNQPLLYERVNLYGTMVLLEAARLARTRKFIFASSSSIYGISNTLPFTESDTNNLPISPYAATKLGAEKVCYAWAHLYGIQVVCLRFFTVYGPRQRPDLAIRKFTEMIGRGDPLPVFGDGASGRDYTYVEDTVQGIMGALSYHGPAFDIFNLGNSSPVSLNCLIGAIESALGKRAILRREPDQPGDVPITYADISKAKALLGYAPQTPFEQGIRKFVNWYLLRHDELRAAATSCA